MTRLSRHLYGNVKRPQNKLVNPPSAQVFYLLHPAIIDVITLSDTAADHRGCLHGFLQGDTGIHMGSLGSLGCDVLFSVSATDPLDLEQASPGDRTGILGRVVLSGGGTTGYRFTIRCGNIQDHYMSTHLCRSVCVCE